MMKSRHIPEPIKLALSPLSLAFSMMFLRKSKDTLFLPPISTKAQRNLKKKSTCKKQQMLDLLTLKGIKPEGFLKCSVHFPEGGE